MTCIAAIIERNYSSLHIKVIDCEIHNVLKFDGFIQCAQAFTEITTHFSFFGPKISSAADLCNQKILPSHSWKEKIYQAQEILPSPIDDVFHANKLVDPTTSSTNSLTIYQTLLTKKIYYH